MNARCLPFVVVALASTAMTLRAQAPAAPASVPIRDNSFLVEEAFNQEWGVVQHVFTFQQYRDVSGWGATFTQEWPAPRERHQLSFTVPVQRSATSEGNRTGVGDVALNYRYQVPMASGSRVAMSPRASLLIPSGHARWGQGLGSPGLEINLPVSAELSSRWVTHTNLGGSWTPSAQNELGDESRSLRLFAGQSLIWLIHPKFNVMVEAFGVRADQVIAPDRTRTTSSFLVSPGVRAAFDLPSGLQIVPGVAMPIGVGWSDGERGIFLYLSFEHPFRRQ